eukprot:CAMPEP_0197608174 /NCGR_PEP_ID=MMETSP1326-20131121/48534_1 /TAXON_ID=1155430 /ORGANISM="Genus nov. species nov., Strain RCC2288" /LENGTH=63 /DNA_ID=CAMNT_0043176343 /DNA_START=275 /DNA_END=466 /DNA_ORIENTATION=-
MPSGGSDHRRPDAFASAHELPDERAGGAWEAHRAARFEFLQQHRSDECSGELGGGRGVGERRM